MTKIQKWIAGIASLLTLLLTILGAVSGIFGDVAEWFAEREARQIREKKVLAMIMDWEKYRNDKDLPFTLQILYEERGEVIDSIAFDVQQLNNLIWYSMEKYHIKDSCTIPCRYWFRKDEHGTIFYRDRIIVDGIKIFTHMYTVNWNATIGKWEYVNNDFEKKSIPHKWELTNDN